MGKRQLRVKSNSVNHSMIRLLKYKHVKTDDLTYGLWMFAEDWKTRHKALSQPYLLVRQLVAGWIIYQQIKADTFTKLNPPL